MLILTYFDAGNCRKCRQCAKTEGEGACSEETAREAARGASDARKNSLREDPS